MINERLLLNSSTGEVMIVVQCKDGKVSVISKKSFLVVKECLNATLVAVDDFTNTFSEQLLIVCKKTVAPENKLFPFIFIDGANEYSNFKNNIIIQTSAEGKV